MSYELSVGNKGIGKIPFGNQIIVMNCNFVFFDNRLRDAQGFQGVIPVNNQSMFGVFFFGIAMEIKQFICIYFWLVPEASGQKSIKPIGSFFSDFF